MPGSPPDEEQGNFWDDIEDYFGWFDPATWLSDIGDLISEGLGVLAGPIAALGEGFNNFIDGVGDFFENLIESLGTWFEDLGQWFDNLISYLDPTSERFFLTLSIIPSEGYLEEYATDIKTMLDGKFTFISEIRDFLGNLFGAVIDPDPAPPEFKINLPGGKWGQGSLKIIDFSLFAPYRAFILNFIRVLLWIPFLLKLYKRLPQLVYQ